MADNLRLTLSSGDRLVRVRAAAADLYAPMRISISAQEAGAWDFEEPAWCGLAGGVFGDRIAVWSARRLIVIPAHLGEEPELIDTDEDIFSVIGMATNWLIVCETSVRLHAGQTELARHELGDVVIRTRWQPPNLHVVDGRGREDTFIVDGDRLFPHDA